MQQINPCTGAVHELHLHFVVIEVVLHQRTSAKKNTVGGPFDFSGAGKHKNITREKKITSEVKIDHHRVMGDRKKGKKDGCSSSRRVPSI